MSIGEICHRHGICPKIYTAGFQVKNFTPSILPNFNSFRDGIRIRYTLYFHLYCESRCFWRNLHRWQKFHTVKYHLWLSEVEALGHALEIGH